jgi:heparin/heparan-sulfate lyase
MLTRRNFLKWASASVIIILGGLGGLISWRKFGNNNTEKTGDETDMNRENNESEQLIYPLPPVAPPTEHPRLFLRKSDLPALKAKVNRPEMKRTWNAIVEKSKSKPNGAKWSEVLDSLQAGALVYVLQGDEQAGLNAKNLVMQHLGHYDPEPKSKNSENNSRNYSEFIGKFSIVYDWCYPLFTEEEKRTIVSTFKRLAAKMETGYPPTKQSSITNHASENLLMKDLLSAGVAVYDEDREIYNLVAGRFFSEMLPARNFFYPSGAYHQGTTYGIFRFSCDLWPLWIFDRMGHGNVYDAGQGGIPYQWIYMRRPDGMLMPQGDTTPNAFYPIGKYGTIHMIIFMMTGSYYKNPYFLMEYDRELSSRSTDAESGETAVDKQMYSILFNDLDVKRKPIQELPLSRYFASPLGQMIARTGWDDGKNMVDKQSPVAVALMKIGEYNYGNHDHRDIGSFQMYYKGSLAIDSGIYQGTEGSYGDPPQVNYTKATISHNCVLVYDPDDTSTAKQNDGGQRTVAQPMNLQELLNNGFRTGEVLGHEIGPDPLQPDYTYLKGEISKAYSDKVKQYFRSFVFLNLKNSEHPAALIVFDKVVSSNENFKKYWLLHSIEEPQSEGNVTTIRRSTDGYQGEMVVHTLLPEQTNTTIEKVGGAGHEFDVFGKNFPNYWDKNEDVKEQGAWRIQVSPQQAAETDHFLHVLQVKDIDGAQPLAVEKIETDLVAGVRMMDRVVLFSKSGERLKGTVDFPMSDAGAELKILVCDLTEGTWKLEKDGAASTHQVSKDGGAAYFSGTAGSYRLTYA